jgi:propionate catabolism operon transcriptional regulator
MSETLLESELFGYEDGAFTGARKGGKVGLFEAAHNGTLFLDEVGEMPLALQTRLLRVLQEREVLRVGATEPTPVNVRVIAATHRDLAEQVAQGQFRLDLYYRLNILRLDVPPLRARLADLPALIEAIHVRLCRRIKADAGATRPLLQALIELAMSYGWPGNVRELENIIERMLAYAQVELPGQAGQGRSRRHEQHERLQEAWPSSQAHAFWRATAPELFGQHPQVDALMAGGQQSPQPSPPTGLHARKADAERAEIESVLQACEGDRAEAARRLGISRTTLWRKLGRASKQTTR